MLSISSELIELFMYLSILSSCLLILKTIFQFFKWFLGWWFIMNVDIYTEQPILDVGQTIESWFGSVNDTSKNICIIFSYFILFVFVLCIFGLIFRRKWYILTF